MQIKKVHFMGIGGSGVSGVASLAQSLGYEVTGCDLKHDTNYSHNIFVGHDVSHIKDCDLVVVSPAVFYQNVDNPELTEAKKRGILFTWQEFVGKYLQPGKKVICVAGTHGKSTTTAMLGKVLSDLGLDPTVILGARYDPWGGNSRFGKGEYLVVEADEFFDNFLYYNPDAAILNNIEFDHPDYFKDEKQLIDSFIKFIKQIKDKGILVANTDFEKVNKVLAETNTDHLKVISFSPKTQKDTIPLLVIGEHNQANAMAVICLCEALGLDPKAVKKSLKDFSGISRRLEKIGTTTSGAVVFDDYAHHPTAIAATLKALRGTYPNKTIWAIDEPHGYLRTKALLDNYATVFDSADHVIIGPIFKAREKDTLGLTPQLVAQKTMHPSVFGMDSFAEIINKLQLEIKPDDVILVMGAGESYLWARQLLKI